MAQDRESSALTFPWEEASNFLGLLKAVLPTCGVILFKPVDFFKKLVDFKDADLKKRIKAAFVFALIMGYFKLILDMANVYWFKFFMKSVASSSLNSQASLISLAFLDSPFLLLRPIIGFTATLGLVAFGVKLVLGFNKTLIPAFLVVCYQSAAVLFFCIPIVGGVFGLVWSLALIAVGIKEAYGINLLRSVVTAVVLPVLILFSVVLAMGPTLSRMLVSFYPEAQPQLVKFNDVAAYATTASVIQAAKAYHDDLGFYPAHLGVLNRYVESSVIDDVTNPGMPSGYKYNYMRLDDNRFILVASPVTMGSSGSFTFYGDETGKVRLGNAGGPWIKDAREMEDLAFRRTS